MVSFRRSVCHKIISIEGGVVVLCWYFITKIKLKRKPMSFEIFAVYHQQKTVYSLILYLNVYLGLPLVLAECTHCIYMQR